MWNIFYLEKEIKTDRFKDVVSITIYYFEQNGQNVFAPTSYNGSNILKSRTIYDKDIPIILSNVVYRRKEALWKGDIMADFNKKDGTALRIAISWYGDFFAVVGEKGIYLVKGSTASKTWDKLIKNSIRNGLNRRI